MKYWKEVKEGMQYNANGITLIGEYSDTIVSIGEDNGLVKFVEEGNGLYSTYMSKKDAIKALEEAISWIEGE